MTSVIKFPCKICKNNLTNSDQATQCDLWDSWVYIKCNDLNSNDPWFCISCCSKIFPFNTVKNKNFTSNFYDINKSKDMVDKDSPLSSKLSEHLKQLDNQFNNMSLPPDAINSDNPENTVSSKYNDIDVTNFPYFI